MPQLKHQTEKQFMAEVIRLAKLKGWYVYHTHNSQRSEPGFPDLVLVRPPRIVFAELKSEKGRLTQAQQEWLGALLKCEAGNIDVCYWKPSLMDAVIMVLS